MCSKESQSGKRQVSYAIVANIVFCKFYKSITRALLGALEEAWAREKLRDFSYVRFTVILFLWSQMNWTKLFYFSRDDIFRDTVLVLPVQGKHSHIKVNSIIQLTFCCGELSGSDCIWLSCMRGIWIQNYPPSVASTGVMPHLVPIVIYLHPLLLDVVSKFILHSRSETAPNLVALFHSLSRFPQML